MTNAELIAALRCEIDCGNCAYHTEMAWNRCDECGMRCDAADALEAAEQRIAELEKQAEAFKEESEAYKFGYLDGKTESDRQIEGLQTARKIF